MIVEFIGLPASGKTTYAKALHKLGVIKGRKVNYPLSKLYERKWLYRNFLKLFIVFVFFLLNPIRSFKLIVMIIRSNQKNVMDNFRLITNSAYILRSIEKYGKEYEIVIFDEGLIHHGWAIAIGAKNEFNINMYLELCKRKFKDRKLIYITCSESIIANRLKKRGVNNQRDKFIFENINHLSELMETILKVETNDKVLILNNDSKDILEHNIGKILKELN